MPSVLGIHETIIYVAKLDAATEFYTGLLGLVAIGGALGPVGRAFRVPGGSVLLLFDPEQSIRNGRGIPAHGAIGPCHLAFSIESSEYEAWRARLDGAGVEIEQEQVWPGGARSLYFRDPDGNSVELMAGDFWAHRERDRESSSFPPSP
ncbi:MAG: VOC family protein [Phycisphaerales bacterium]|nr:VOC family protein [Phycisphaerales bacterium]